MIKNLRQYAAILFTIALFAPYAGFADSPVLPIKRGVTPNLSVSTVTASTSIQAPLIKGSGGTTRIAIPNNSTTTITSTAPTTGSAVGTVVDTNSTYTGGDRLLVVRNNGTDKAYVSQGGGLFVLGSIGNASGTAGFVGGVSDSGGARTAITFGNINALTNSASNIWCGYSDNGVTSQLCLRKDGSLIPSNNSVSTVGTANNGFSAIYTGNLNDTAGNLRWQAGTGTGTLNIGRAVDGATAVAHKFGNSNALSTSGAHIAEFYNDNLSTLKLSIDKDGSLIAGTSGTPSVGSAAGAFQNLFLTSAVADTNSVQRINVAAGAQSNYRSGQASGGAVAHRFGGSSSASYTATNDQIAGFYNDNLTTERSYVGYDGSYNGLVNGIGGLQTTQIAAPTGLAVTCSTTGGTLAAATYYFKVWSTSYGSTSTTPSAEVSGVVSSGSTGSCSVSWNAVLGATGYGLGRSTISGSELVLTTITNPTTVSYSDTGSLTPSGALPTSNSTGRVYLATDVVPSVNGTYNLGSTGNRFFAVFASALEDANGTQRFAWPTGASQNTYLAGTAATFDGAHRFGNTNALTTGNIANFYSDNITTKVAHVDANGGYNVDGSGAVTAGSGGFQCTSAGACNIGNTFAPGAVNAFQFTVKSAALPTCNSSLEGVLHGDNTSGGATTHVTRICGCLSNGSSVYAWYNMRTGTVGTTTTCAD